MIEETGFLWILLTGLIYGIIHSAFASVPVKNWMAAQFGLGNPKLYRLFYVMQSSLFSVIYLSLVFILPDRVIYIIPVPWLFVFLLIDLAAAFCAYLGLKQTGISSFLGLEFLFTRENSLQTQSLNTGGFYRYVRHPVYFFSLILIWLLPIMSWNILAFNIGATAYLIIGSHYEERKLIQDFGQEYLDYQKQVPAFWPRLKFKR